MDNRDVRQISDEEVKSELSKEELQETQVLNLQEVRKTIRFEKITSKKPAIAVAVIGILLLLVGGGFQVLKSINTNNNVQKRTTVTKTKKKEYIVNKSLNATKTTMNNPDGTNTIYNVVYAFSDNKLIKESRKYNVNAVAGNEEGNKTITKLATEYKTLINKTEGYSIELKTVDKVALEINIDIDYTKLDLTKVKNIQATKEFTKVDYRLGSLYDDIRKEKLDKGFTVN